VSISGPLARELEELAQDVDMLVFRLERGSEDPGLLLSDRRRTRRDLEKIRDRIRDLSLGL
jgi:hypothetical protein